MVLFPGAPAQLHIFEDRYKTMMQRCLDQQENFGIVLIKTGQEAHGPLADCHPVGCEARIIQVEEVSEGRLNLTAMGVQPFRIAHTTLDDPYLEAEVDPIEMAGIDEAALGSYIEKLNPLVFKYLELTDNEGDEHLGVVSSVEQGCALAHFAIHILGTSLERKQSLLDLQDPAVLYQQVIQLYDDELKMAEMARTSREDKAYGPFSPN